MHTISRKYNLFETSLFGHGCHTFNLFSIPSRPPPFLRYSQWIPNSDNTNLKIVILGSGGLAEDLSSAIKVIEN